MQTPETGLRRSIGLRTVISSGAGLAFSATCFSALIEVGRGLPGGVAWLPILLAGVLTVLAAWVFAELVGLYPTAAGIKLYIEKAFGERAALVVGALYVLVSVAAAAADTYILTTVLRLTLPAVPGWIWVVGVVALIALVNLRGMRMSGLTQDITTYLQYAIVLGISVWALFSPHATIPHLTSTGSGLGLLQAVGVGVFLFMGYEWVMPLAEEVQDVRVIARGMVWTLALLAITYVLMHLALVAVLPAAYPGQWMGWLAAGVADPHVLLAQVLAGGAGRALMLFTTAIATVTTINAGVLTSSRFLYAMARDHALPRTLALLHPRHATPWVATLALSAIALVVGLLVLWTGQFSVLIVLAAAVECLVYVVMGGAVLRLRQLEPDRPRPFRMPGGTWVAWAVIAVFSLLLVGLFVPDSAHTGRLGSQLWALGLGLGLLLLVGLYVWLVVPRLRAKYAALMAQRQRRRPGRLS